MGRVQFTEFRHQSLGDLECLRNIEHEISQKGIQISEIFCRLGLVQQPQGHLVIDTEKPPESFLISAEFIPHEGIRQRGTNLPHFEIALRKEIELANVESALQNQISLLHVSGSSRFTANPQELCKDDIFPLPVAIGLRDRRPC